MLCFLYLDQHFKKRDLSVEQSQKERKYVDKNDKFSRGGHSGR